MGIDFINYFAKNESVLSKADRASIISMIICFILNLTSSVFLIITMQGLHTKFKIRGTPLTLSTSNRFRLTQIEEIFITLTILLSVIAVNVYFDTKTITIKVANALGKYILPTNSPFYILVAVTVFVLACFILSKIAGFAWFTEIKDAQRNKTEILHLKQQVD
jgi:hypothetical protein